MLTDHKHSTSDEWGFFIAGTARAGVYAPPSAGATFDFLAGDVSYVPATQSHYIEDSGTKDVVFLKVLQAPHFSDISVGQWLKLSGPPSCTSLGKTKVDAMNSSPPDRSGPSPLAR